MLAVFAAKLRQVSDCMRLLVSTHARPVAGSLCLRLPPSRCPFRCWTRSQHAIPSKIHKRRLSRTLRRQARGEEQADEVGKRFLRRAIRRLQRIRAKGVDSSNDGEASTSKRATAQASAAYLTRDGQRRRRRMDSRGGGWGGKGKERKTLTRDAAEARAARVEDELQQEVCSNEAVVEAFRRVRRRVRDCQAEACGSAALPGIHTRSAARVFGGAAFVSHSAAVACAPLVWHWSDTFQIS